MFSFVVFNLDGNLATQLKEVYEKDKNCQEVIKDMQSEIKSDFSLSKEGVLLWEDLIYMLDDRNIQL